jgi:hypothetical protein
VGTNQYKCLAETGQNTNIGDFEMVCPQMRHWGFEAGGAFWNGLDVKKVLYTEIQTV